MGGGGLWKPEEEEEESKRRLTGRASDARAERRQILLQEGISLRGGRFDPLPRVRGKEEKRAAEPSDIQAAQV